MMLDEYTEYVQKQLKAGVQVRTGALRKSIEVRCSVDNKQYSMRIALNYYWQWLLDPVPIKKMFTSVYLPDPNHYTRYGEMERSVRYPIDFKIWQEKFNAAYKEDILHKIHEQLMGGNIKVG